MSVLLLPLLAAGCTGGPPPDATDPGEPPWPEWAWSHWIWEDETTQDRTVELVEGYLDRGIPVGAVIIDSPWATGYSTFEWDTGRFPDPQGLVDWLHDQGIRVMLWTVGGINTDVEDLYQEAAEAGYFLQDGPDSGPGVVSWWKGEGSLIDYFNPDAVAWWHGLMDQALAYGIDGWKADGLDYYASLTPYSPALGREVDRLEYSHAYYRDTFTYTREVLGDDRIITSRPVDNYGFLGLGGDAVAFTPPDIAWACWLGDQDATFEGLRAAMDNAYWSADYGYLAFGSDIGGYRDVDDVPQGRTEEVFLRWAAQGAFSPVMENGGGGDHHPWAWSEETADIYGAFVRIHVDLLPYLREEGWRAFQEGRSLFTFLDDERYGYLLGPDLFVQPVLAEGTEVEVHFPDEGRWRWLFDLEQVFEGGTVATLDVPLDRFPAFLRVGSELEAAWLAR